MKQRTIAEKISCTGIGLHSGAPVHMTLHPARAHSGVVFVRTDLPGAVEIPARSAFVTDTVMATTLGRDGATVSTVEHLLSALYGLGIDNVRVELDGPEVPIMDGSAASFVFLIRLAGVFEQRAPRHTLRVREPVQVGDGERWIRIEPARGFHVSYEVDFQHPVIGRQALDDLAITPELFEHEISRARTFGFLEEVRALWDAGLARGGSLDNTVVLDQQRVVNEDGLRWPDEFVRHKVLDLLGDFALVGMAVEGHIRASRAGHALHQALLARLLDSPAAVTDPQPRWLPRLPVPAAVPAA